MAKRLLLLGMLALACSSCVDFERQDLWFRYEEKTDTLRMFSLYGGIFSHGDDKEAMEQLASVMAGGRAFFFSTWIFEYNASELEQAEMAPWNRAEDRPHFRMFRDNMSVRNGKFFLNAEGKLCGCQFIEVKNASRLVKAVNTSINRHVVQLTPQELNKRSQELWLKAAAKDHQWLTLDRGAIVLRIPLTQDDFIRFKRQAGKSIGKESSQNAAWELTRLGSILTSDCWATWRDDFTIINLGFSGQEMNQIGMPVGTRVRGHHEIIDLVKEKYGLLEKAPDIAALSKNFLKSGVIPESAVTPPIPEKK